MDSLDKLLAEIKSDYQKPAKTESLNKQSWQTTSLEQLPIKSDPLIDSLLSQVKADYEEKDREFELKKQQKIQQEQQQKLEALKSQAIAWLKNLDSLSSEGIWFETFAAKYPSKLAAAIDYLASIQ